MKMYLFVILWILSFTITSSSDTILQTTGRQYNQMSYLPRKSLLTQFNINSKKRCIAQCARLLSTCNIAVFNPTGTAQCMFYGESLTMANLTPSVNATVVDFGRNNSNEGCLPTAGITALSSYNLITLGDLNIVSGVQDRTIICGSLISTSFTDFAKTINGNVFPATSYSLEINGQIGSGNPVQVLAGSLAIGTSSAHTIATTDNISYTLDGRTVLIQKGNQGAKIDVNANLTNKCANISNDIKALSNELAALVNISENNISIPTSAVAPLVFYVNKVDTNGMAVFYMDGNTALNNPRVQEIQVVVDVNITNTVQLVIINLSGTSLNFAQGNMAGSWLSSATIGQSRTIWNLYQATSLGLTRNWMGALLAPYAFVNSNANIDGATAVNILVINAEVRTHPINIPTCV